MKDIINKNCYRIKKIIKNITGEYNEDIEQEVYIRTFLNIDKYKEQNKFTSWISTIAVNLCKDYLRKNKKALLNCELPDDIKEKTTPEIIYSSKERQRIILRAINSLPKKMKEVVILYELEDYSYEQISNKLKIPIGTTKSRINNARKILKERLSFLLGEDS